MRDGDRERDRRRSRWGRSPQSTARRRVQCDVRAVMRGVSCRSIVFDIARVSRRGTTSSRFDRGCGGARKSCGIEASRGARAERSGGITAATVAVARSMARGRCVARGRCARGRCAAWRAVDVARARCGAVDRCGRWGAVEGRPVDEAGRRRRAPRAVAHCDEGAPSVDPHPWAVAVPARGGRDPGRGQSNDGSWRRASVMSPRAQTRPQLLTRPARPCKHPYPTSVITLA